MQAGSFPVSWSAGGVFDASVDRLSPPPNSANGCSPLVAASRRRSGVLRIGRRLCRAARRLSRLAFPRAGRDKGRLGSNRPPEAALTEANVFTIPAGAPFLATLARALIEGEHVEGFPGGRGPLELASATIYLPTQRAAAALARALVEASGGTSLILPRIAPLGAFEPTRDELGLAEPEESLSVIAPPAVGELTRLMTLARLTRAWGEALSGAICRVEPDGRKVFDESEPPLVATSSGAGLRAGGRPRRADRRLHHRGRRPKTARQSRDRRFRSLLAHHPRFSKDRLRAMAGLAQRARPDRSRPARRASHRRRNSRPGEQDAARPDHHRRLEPEPIAPPRG